MTDDLRFARWNDEASTAPVFDAIRTWEPSIEPIAASGDTLLFESEATIYAVCLSSATLRNRHLATVVRPGDALVIPAGVGVEAEPGLDWFGLAHRGAPPYHFRERFIQSIAFERLAAPEPSSESAFALVPTTDLRYRTAILGVREGSIASPLAEPATTVWAVASGRLEVFCGETARLVETGDLVFVPHGCVPTVRGAGLAVGFPLLPEILYDSARDRAAASQGPRWSPEPARPPSG